MTILDHIRRWLGCEECLDQLRELRTTVEITRSRGAWWEDDENLAELLRAVDDYLARMW